ncbi:MAG: AAA family ATPase [Candidatus Accumulibacter sp.]|jgi:predicted ATPase|uniref:AAA family ATPase n=1 Tax=Accumulibacter sp. TaxID=2053492 RepID=UPI001AD36117|nr:AAA family ATPase [Accumulibacter sp.]MBN8437009.1 AAA family ATPase [Accumulibacter sp.]
MVAFKSLAVENFVAFQKRLEWREHASLNVIIGENDTGKTHLLKLLYSMARAIEDYARKKAGPEPKELSELLAHKLRWAFLPQKLELGRLVSRGSGNRLSVNLGWNTGGHLKFAFGKDTTTRIVEIDTHRVADLGGSKASFLPPKEILSIFDAIVATRETVEIASFDDTYYDLVQDYRQPPTSGNLQANIKKALVHLENVTGSGEVEMEKDGNIVFRRGKEVFNMHQTAEGIKKIGILSRLMRNRRLTPAGGCMLFVDEPEVNLHPKAIVLFAEMLHEFAQSGIQVYLTTHSYFLLKRLEQLAREKNTDYSLLDLRKQDGAGVTGTVSKLADGLPQNPIVEESLRLFDRDVQLDLAD